MPLSPIFIVGAPRSGTTMVRLLLNAHSRIAVAPETYFYSRTWERFARTDDTVSWGKAVDDFMALCERKFKPPIELSDVREPLLRDHAGDWRALFSLPIESWAKAQGKIRWGEKTPHHIFYADIFMRDFPAARVIEVVRDPRGCVNSMQKARFFTDNVVLNALNWREFASSGSARLLEAVPRDQLLSVGYERLLEAPADTLAEIFDFLDEPFEPAVLDFWRTTDTYMPRRNSPLITKPVSNENRDRWRVELNSSQIALIELVTRREMRKLGYVREGRNSAADLIRAAPTGAYWFLKRCQRWGARSHTVRYRPFARLRRLLGPRRPARLEHR